jgi:hypothetical protein
LSWFIFAASAVVATLLTVGVVKLVLRGDPEVKHLTVVRMAPGQPAVVYSRIGLYIPRDGPQKLELKETVGDAVSYIAPFPIHPQYTTDNQFPQYMNYTVPVRDTTNETPPELSAPYRSTLKKFQAKWVGDLKGTIDGSGKLVEGAANLEGAVTNGTGRELKNVYVAYRYPRGSVMEDWLLYQPVWAKGETLDLSKLSSRDTLYVDDTKDLVPGKDRKLKGRFEGSADWERYWYKPFRGGIAEKPWKDDAEAVPRSFPMLSLFDRLQPAKMNSENKTRFELLRRGGRFLDLSPAELAGGLIVLAEADDTPLPFPFLVEGRPVGGQGTTYYQAVLPLDRSELEKPAAATTQP